MFHNLFLKDNTKFRTKLAKLSEDQIENMRQDMLNYCRLCLVKKGCVDIQNDEWTNKFYKLNIELVSQYKLPGSICRCCETAINAFYHKKERFDKNQWTLFRIARALQKKRESLKDSKFLPDHLAASMDSVEMETCNQVYKSILNCKSENIPIVFGTSPCADNKDEIIEMTPIGTMTLEDLKNVTLIEIKEAENETYKECVAYDEKKYGDFAGKINKPVSCILTDWNDDDVQPMDDVQENHLEGANCKYESSVLDDNKEEINNYNEECSQIPSDEHFAEGDYYEEQVENYDEQYAAVDTHEIEVIENNYKEEPSELESQCKPKYESDGNIVYDSNAYEHIENESYLVNNVLNEAVNQASVSVYENQYENNVPVNIISEQYTNIPCITNGDNYTNSITRGEYAESGYGSQPVDDFDSSPSEQYELENKCKPLVNATECDSQSATLADSFVDLFSEKSLLTTVPTKEKVTKKIIEVAEKDDILKRCRQKKIPQRFAGFEEGESDQWQWKVKVLETLVTLFKQESTSNEEIKEKIHSLLWPEDKDNSVPVTSNVRLNSYLSVRVDKGHLNRKLAEISLLSKKQLQNLCFADIFEDVIPVAPLDTVDVDKEKKHTDFVVKHGTPKVVFNKQNIPEFNFKLNTYGKPTCVKVNSVPQITEQLNQKRTPTPTPQSSRNKPKPRISRPSRGNQAHTSVSPAASVAIQGDMDPLTSGSPLNVISNVNNFEPTQQMIKGDKTSTLVSRTDGKQPGLIKTNTKVASTAAQFNDHAPLAQLNQEVATVSTSSSTQNVKSDSPELVDSKEDLDQKVFPSDPPTPIKNLPQFLRSLKKLRLLPSEMTARNAMEPKVEQSLTSNDGSDDTYPTIVYEDENVCATNRLMPKKRISETYAQAHVKKRKLLSSAGSEGHASAYTNSFNDSMRQDCPTAALCDQIYDIAQGKRPSNVSFLENLSTPGKESFKKEVKPLSHGYLSSLDLNKDEFSPQTMNFKANPLNSCEMKNISPQENNFNGTELRDDSTHNEEVMLPCEMKQRMENVEENVVLKDDSTQYEEVKQSYEVKQLMENVVQNICTNKICSNEEMANQLHESNPTSCDIDKQSDQVLAVPKADQVFLKVSSTTFRNSSRLRVCSIKEMQSEKNSTKSNKKSTPDRNPTKSNNNCTTNRNSTKSNNKSTTDRNSTKSNKSTIDRESTKSNKSTIDRESTKSNKSTIDRESTKSNKKPIKNKKLKEKINRSQRKKDIIQLERQKLDKIIKEQAVLLIEELWHKKKEPTVSSPNISIKEESMSCDESPNISSENKPMSPGKSSNTSTSTIDSPVRNRNNSASQPKTVRPSKLAGDVSKANDSICDTRPIRKSTPARNSVSLVKETTTRSISNSSLVKDSIPATNVKPSEPQRPLVTPIKFTPIIGKIINGIKQLTKSPPSPNTSFINSPTIKDKLVETNVTKSQGNSMKLPQIHTTPPNRTKGTNANFKVTSRASTLPQIHKTPPNRTKGISANSKVTSRASTGVWVTKNNPSTGKKSTKPISRHSLPNTKPSSSLTTSKITPQASSILNGDASKKYLSYASYQIKFLFDQVIRPSECMEEDFEVPYKYRRKL